jgi:hypothetical protein
MNTKPVYLITFFTFIKFEIWECSLTEEEHNRYNFQYYEIFCFS